MYITDKFIANDRVPMNFCNFWVAENEGIYWEVINKVK
jgi:hypothetical protein